MKLDSKGTMSSFTPETFIVSDGSWQDIEEACVTMIDMYRQPIVYENNFRICIHVAKATLFQMFFGRNDEDKATRISLIKRYYRR